MDKASKPVEIDKTVMSERLVGILPLVLELKE